MKIEATVWLREQRLYFTAQFGICREIEEELRTYLELAAEQMESRGATLPNSQEDPARAARLRYGGVAQAAESMLDQRGLP